MSDTDESVTNTIEVRDELLDRFENLTSKIEASLDHNDVDEVAFLLSERARVLDSLRLSTQEHPLSDEQVQRLRERDGRLEERLLEARGSLDAEAATTRAKGRAARLYVKNS